MKYRRKPIVIEAEQWYPPEHPRDEFNYVLTLGITWNSKERKYYLNTSEGQHEVMPGDFIVTGIRGEKYPVKPDIFLSNYEPINEQTKDNEL